MTNIHPIILASAAAAALCSAGAPARAEAPDSGQGRGGIAAGIEPTLTVVRMGNFGDDDIAEVSGSDVTASGTLFSVQGTFLFDYGVSATTRLGVRISAGRIDNSDDSSGSARQLYVGPAYTALVGALSLGLEAGLQWYSFDDISANVDARGVYEDDLQELDGESILALGLAGRIGMRIPLSKQVEVIPEFRMQVTPMVLAQEGADVFYYDEQGSVTLRGASSLLGVSGSLFVGVRWLLGN